MIFVKDLYKNLGHDISSTVCPQCSRPRLYCHCSTNHNATYFWQEDIASSSSSNSSERSITPPPTHFNIPVSTTSSPLTPLTSQLIPHNTSKYNHHDTGIVSTTTATTATSATAALPSIHSIARLVSPSSSLTPTTSTMGYSSNNNGIPNNRLQVRHLIIPIHDPSDDIDSDTPIYKSMEESHGNLGEFANNSSEELIHQIYNNFNSSNSSASSPLLTEEDDKLVELARDP
ncbi:hypothetical protein BDF20DRAFT_225436 [Mycotypha africana]|uniref:uncharacterized protein n=1 Tax=Mycotypha africana TaxID=64632 RepID=UPI0023007018|nr:uncharacterized protein BDF20DRAFT_225436 [Mycotypha africana]KAI8967595.1 hypothetical protein BDF20DRAFT_225436 [Mycotypha africana]